MIKQTELWQKQQLDHQMVQVQHANLQEVDGVITVQDQKENSLKTCEIMELFCYFSSQCIS